MLVAARTGAWTKSGGGVPTARDYVQDGLIAMWDGIESEFDGSIWRDLTHGYELNFNNFTVKDQSYRRVNESGRVDNAEFFVPSEGSILDVLSAYNNAGDSTVEYYQGDSINTSTGVALAGLSSANNYFGKGQVSSNVSKVYLRSQGSSYWPSQVVTPTLGPGIWSHTSTVINGGLLYGWYNGIELQYSTQPPAYDVDATRFMLNRACAYKNLRIYSRALIVEEIAYNYAIDVARFGPYKIT